MSICRSYPVSCNELVPPETEPTNFTTTAPVCVKMVGYSNYKFRPVVSNKPLSYSDRNIPGINPYGSANLVW